MVVCGPDVCVHLWEQRPPYSRAGSQDARVSERSLLPFSPARRCSPPRRARGEVCPPAHHPASGPRAPLLVCSRLESAGVLLPAEAGDERATDVLNKALATAPDARMAEIDRRTALLVGRLKCEG